MSEFINTNSHLVELLYKVNPTTYVALVNDKSYTIPILKLLYEIGYNLLYGNLPLPDSYRDKLRGQVSKLRQLTSGSKSPQSLAHKKNFVLENRAFIRLLLHTFLKLFYKDVCQVSVGSCTSRKDGTFSDGEDFDQTSSPDRSPTPVF